MGQPQPPPDPLSDPTVKSFFDTLGANVGVQRQIRLTLLAIQNAVLANDPAANERFVALQSITASSSNVAFYKGLAGQITAAQASVARGDTGGQPVLNFQNAIGVQASAVLDQHDQLVVVRDKTVAIAPDQATATANAAAVTAALAKVHTNATGDTNPFFTQLPTLQAQAAAAVAALAPVAG